MAHYIKLCRFDPDVHRSEDMLEFCKHFMLGGASAMIVKTAFAPIERVKLILQLQAASTRIGIRSKYTGILDCLVRIPKEEGLRGYWKGNLVNAMRYFPAQALSFAFWNEYKKLLLGGVDEKSNFRRFFVGSIVAGSAAGATSQLFVYPLDFARTRLSLDIGKRDKREFKGLIDCLVQIYKSDGFRGLYRGFNISVNGIIVYRGISYGFYDICRVILSPTQDSFWTKIALAQVSAMIASFVSYPFDTVCRRLMLQSGLKVEERIYKNAAHCWLVIARDEGLNAFFKGALINTYRCTGTALTLIIYEEVRKWI